ncbi:MAG: acyl carrier protein [Chitinophagaceae bacterium]|nr:acyl carrier protein [Chitinophagaceae bacterium]
MNKEQVIEIINEFLVEDFEVDADKITPDANLKETLDLDSLDYVDLVVSIESNFGFKVKPEDFQAMVVVDDFYDYVTRKVAEKSAA